MFCEKWICRLQHRIVYQHVTFPASYTSLHQLHQFAPATPVCTNYTRIKCQNKPQNGLFCGEYGILITAYVEVLMANNRFANRLLYEGPLEQYSCVCKCSPGWPMASGQNSFESCFLFVWKTQGLCLDRRFVLILFYVNNFWLVLSALQYHVVLCCLYWC